MATSNQPFLSCCIPDFELDCCVVQAYSLCQESCANCWLLDEWSKVGFKSMRFIGEFRHLEKFCFHLKLMELPFHKAQNQWRLPNCWLSWNPNVLKGARENFETPVGIDTGILGCIAFMCQMFITVNHSGFEFKQFIESTLRLSAETGSAPSFGQFR